MSLPPFSDSATCPKCGHGDVHVKYSVGRTSGFGSCNYYCPLHGKFQEHLERVCQRCHYEWAEAVLAPTDGGEQTWGDERATLPLHGLPGATVVPLLQRAGPGASRR